MDYTANVANSEIDVEQIRTILVQGDATYPHIQFVLDPSLSGLSWRVRGYYRDFNDAVLSDEITPTETETSVTVDWYVSTDFTTHYGEMQLVLVGTDALGETVVKSLGNVLIGRDFTISTTQVITQNLFEQLMAQLTSGAGIMKIDQTLPQTFVGGIPKLAADRVISDDNDLVDKKHVADVVATVTAGDFNHNDLSNKQGGSAGEYYHMTQAENSALHGHGNKAALDLVFGTNTGDQVAGDFNHNDLSNKQGGSAGEYYHTTQAQNTALHSHTNKTALDAVSGTNTGDQDVSGAISTHNTDEGAHVDKEKTSNKVTSISAVSTDTQYPSAKCTYGAISTHNSDASAHSTQISAAISTHNANTSAHADKEKTSNKVTSISSASTDVQYPSAKCTYDAIAEQRAERYTAVWDKVNAQCTRANSAAGITTTITNFCHRGTVNASRSNPFDSIYPWSAIGVCNISIDLYRALASGGDIRDCIVAWLGDPDFDYNHANGVWVYTPGFWYTVQNIGTSRHFTISPFEQPGYIFSPEKIEGRWFGGVYTLTISGSSTTCLLPKPGMPGKNVAMSTLHTYAKNWGASIENIYGYSATDVLMIVEFATMDTQTAIGNGVSDLYRQNGYTIKANATASATVKILTADASTYCIPGAIFDIGATDGSASVGSYIIASTALDADPTYTMVTLTTDGSTPASVTATTANFWSVHGLSNTVDASIGAGSGYIGTNGKSNAYYRGQVAHANLWRYVLGAYRQTGTGKIWIANNPAEADAYDALNTTVHKDTGFALPQGAAGAAADGYISALRLCTDVPAAPFCETIGGSSANPVGDYCYVPALATANTILLAGGSAAYGSPCGRFCGGWGPSAAASYWGYGAVPVLKSP